MAVRIFLWKSRLLLLTSQYEKGVTVGLAHAVAQHLAAAKLAFLAVHAVIAFNFNQQAGIAEAHPVAGSGAVYVGIRATGNEDGPISFI